MTRITLILKTQAETAIFGTPTATADGFTVQISNYSALYTWAGTATASGSVAISGSGLVTVTGVSGSTSSTATITTTRTGYVSSSATVTETSLTSFSSTSVILSSTSNYTVPVGAKVIKIWSIGAGGSATFLCDGGGANNGNAGTASYRHGFISNTNVVVSGSIGQPVTSVCDLMTAGGSTTLSNLSTVISPSISSIVGGGGGANGFAADGASSDGLSTYTLWTNSTTRRDYVGVNAVITDAGGNATTHTYGKGGTGTGSAGAIVLQFLPATDLVLPFTGSGSFTIPVGYSSVKIWAVGGGGIGDIYCDGGPTTNGGYGGIAYKTWSVSSGQVITYSAGVALSGVANSFCTSPTNGNASTATLNSITITGSAGLGNGTNGSGSGGDGSGVYGSDVSSIYAAYATYSPSTPTYGLRGVSTNTAGLIGGIVLVKFMV